MPIQPLNRNARIVKTFRRLPHWSQTGTTYFVTFRLADSLPFPKLLQLKAERELWLRLHPQPWITKTATEYYNRFVVLIEKWLDAGVGECHLRNSEVRQKVQNCLLHFQGERYDITDFVIMPNHLHMILTPLPGNSLSDILHGLKGVSAREANKMINRTGAFWQDESFDHIIRNENKLAKFKRYIAANPLKARLSPVDYTLYLS